MNSETISVIGLGYVGLPLALAFAKHFKTIGFDISTERVNKLKSGIDVTREGLEIELKTSNLRITDQLEDLKGSNIFIIAVPTPIDSNRSPDLSALERACKDIGSIISKGSVVVLESTVYPGVTEEFCGPIIAHTSGLKSGSEFKLAYSPERINPGDREHSIDKVIKVVSGQDNETLEQISAIYSKVALAGVFKASSIKVAEAAKVLENTQRDLNIALMNELAIILDRMNLRTADVLAAAGTKWNFLKFTPGLVGGHCIGVDPYYLTTKAEQLGYHPQVILAGRRINDNMGRFIANRCVKLLVNSGLQPKGAKVGILGITFKENVADLRNSRVPDIVFELQQFGAEVLVNDPLVPSAECEAEYGIPLVPIEKFSGLSALILAVPHSSYLAMKTVSLSNCLLPKGIILDVKSALAPISLPTGVGYWSL